MHNLAAQGVGIIYISHKMSELDEVCDRVTVLRDGCYVGTRVVKDTPRDELIAMMVGRELDQYYTRDHVENTEVVLRCENLSDGKKKALGASRACPLKCARARSSASPAWSARAAARPCSASSASRPAPPATCT